MSLRFHKPERSGFHSALAQNISPRSDTHSNTTDKWTSMFLRQLFGRLQPIVSSAECCLGHEQISFFGVFILLLQQPGTKQNFMFFMHCSLKFIMIELLIIHVRYAAFTNHSRDSIGAQHLQLFSFSFHSIYSVQSPTEAPSTNRRNHRGTGTLTHNKNI